MHIKKILTVVAVLGMASFAASAAELVVKNSIQGRAGIHTVVRAETEQPTIALSKQGKGVGRSVDAEKEFKHPQWHNPSRPLTAATANN